MVSGIYAIENIINNKKYIGSAKNFKKRWYVHKSALNHNNHDNSYLQKAWNKYGVNNFIFSILEEVELDKLIEREQYYIDLYDVCNRNKGYNLSPTAGNTLGFKFSEKSKLIMSLLKKDKPSTRKNYKHSEETKNKLRKKGKGLGRKTSEKTKEKQRKPHGAMSDITKKKLSDWRKGLIPSEKNGRWMIKKDKIIKNTDNTIKNRGENNGMSITNKKEVIAIRNDYDNGLSISDLMIKYDKKYMFIYKIVKKLRWSWLDNSRLSN
jgi:group I intron endonuclease